MRNLSLQRVVAAVESAKMHVRSIPIDRQAVRVCGYGDGDGEPFLSCLCQGSSSSLFFPHFDTAFSSPLLLLLLLSPLFMDLPSSPSFSTFFTFLTDYSFL